MKYGAEDIMSNESFDSMIIRERERLNKQREDILEKQKQLDQELAVVNREIEAIDSYEAIKACKPIKKTNAARTGKSSNVLQLLQSNSQGMTRGAIIDAMGVKGNKSEEQSISNALKFLKKQGTIKAEGDGTYLAV
jgi:hypothetical protein